MILFDFKKYFQLTCKYIIHILKGKSKKGHGIHSPFVYNFTVKVVAAKSGDFEDIEKLRDSLLNSKVKIAITDFGAGSKVNKHEMRTLGSIARYSTSKKINKFLYRLVKFLQPEIIIELGTSLGFSALYMSKATKSKIITIEGDPVLAKKAGDNFKRLNLSNIELINNQFENALPELISGITCRTMVFIDGNHTFEATMKYFQMLYKHLPDSTVLIFDDINWSGGMQKAWTEIVSSPDVPLTIDLFHVGLVFLNKKYYKQHYLIKF